MGKKRDRRQSPFGDSVALAKKRSKVLKRNNQRGLSSKILKEALIQQKEIEEEEGNHTNKAFSETKEEAIKHEDEQEDVDGFTGFSDTQICFGDDDDKIVEDDEKLMEAILSIDKGLQDALVDLITEKIKEKDENISSETGSLPKSYESLIYMYKGVGEYLSKYTTGKIPQAFKHAPSMQQLLDDVVLYLTEPENWSPNAMFKVTRIFASNFGTEKAERFYRRVLLPRVRDDIRKNKRLHFDMYQALKKALYKPKAFNKGILFPLLCESENCSLREAHIIGSIIRKLTIPSGHSIAALLKLAEMEYNGTRSYFIKIILEKNYALSDSVVDAIASYFMRFLKEREFMPVIWHQSLLAFVQRYKNRLRKEDKDKLIKLVEKQKHYLVTPEIIRELENGCSRGEKPITSTVSVINKPIEEDRFDIPYVPMEED